MKNFLTPSVYSIITLILIAAATISILNTYAQRHWPNDTTTQQTSSIVLASNESSRPVQLTIPKLNIKHTIEPVGLTDKGAMGAPEDPGGIGWYTGSVNPGAVGSAVITGHYGWKGDVPAIFDTLSDLEIGDTVTVEDENGISHSFAVSEMHTYARDAIVPEIFNSSDNRARLNIITCTGRWNAAINEYDERLVVFTIAQ